MPDPSRLIFLDTETTGLAGGTGTCAFLIGIGNVEGMKFVVRHYAGLSGRKGHARGAG